MLVSYFSDIHIEHRQRAGKPAQEWAATASERVGTDRGRLLALGPDLRQLEATDLLLLPGDIGLMTAGAPSALSYAAACHEFLGCPVIFTPGNHEFYGTEFTSTRQRMLDASISGVHVLDRGEAEVEVQGVRVRILGCTLWSDYLALGDERRKAMSTAAYCMNDHRVISFEDQTFSPRHALAEHELSRAWLQERLAEPHAGPSIVATHHGPTTQLLHPGFGLNELTPAFLSRMDPLIEAGGKAGVVSWVFGHHHWSNLPIDIGGVKVLTSQPGYPGEHAAWRGPGQFRIEQTGGTGWTAIPLDTVVRCKKCGELHRAVPDWFGAPRNCGNPNCHGLPKHMRPVRDQAAASDLPRPTVVLPEIAWPPNPWRYER
jgi:hypothetical protein